MLTVTHDDAVTVIAMDDGRVNALSPDMQSAIHVALDEADERGDAIVLAGRDGRFSGGFDLGVMSEGGAAATEMVLGGFLLSRRLLATARPVVIACTGHAMAMGAFLLNAADLRIGASGPYKIAANEVAIGMIVPHAALELMRIRLSPSALQRSAVLAEVFDPRTAVTAGYLDRVVDPSEVVDTAFEAASALAGTLDPTAHRRTKQRLRARQIAAIDAAIERDRAELAAIFTLR